ncbi:MAG: purine-binding chemotaxis protein CheW [Lachnospiraceae bacterium]|nr:purine-binding chemotaxis protein CheW [Lachnospiraceae bacterium]
MEGLREIEVQGSVQYIVVKFGDEQFGIDIKYIDNIVRMQRITRVPKVQNFIKGVINLRGEVIPVVSLRIKMELEEDEITKKTRIIIIRLENGEVIGMLVDEVKEVVTLQASQIEKMAYDSKEDAKTNFISGVGKDKGELISLLDMNLVFAEKEKAN